MRVSTFKRVIAELFILSLPLRMLSVFRPFTGVFGMQAESFSFVFHIIGLFLLLLSSRFKIKCNNKSSLINYFWKMILVFSVISLIMSIYIDAKYGKYNDNSPYLAVVKLLLDFIQYIFVFIYCKEVFRILGKEKLLNLLLIGTRIPLVIGYIQILTMFGMPGISSIYSFLSEPLALNTYQKQISLTFYEPSWAAIFIGVVVIPLHMACLINSCRKTSSCIIEMIIWLPVIIMTKSTTAYLLTFASIGIATVRMVFNKTHNKNSRIIAIVIVCSGILLFNNLQYIDDKLGLNFTYLFQDKLTNMNNISTASRTIPLIGNWEIFKLFPIIGCGNGLQGYFFGTVVSPDLYRDIYLDNAVYRMLNGESSTIPNGQLFFPGILSGYGIIGIVLFAIFIKKSLKSLKTQSGVFKDLYLLALPSIIISGFKSEFVGIIYIWVILSIPHMIDDKEGIKDGKMERVLQ